MLKCCTALLMWKCADMIAIVPLTQHGQLCCGVHCLPTGRGTHTGVPPLHLRGEPPDTQHLSHFEPADVDSAHFLLQWCTILEPHDLLWRGICYTVQGHVVARGNNLILRGNRQAHRLTWRCFCRGESQGEEG